MDRRAFMQRGLMGGALLAAGGVSLHAWRGSFLEPPAGLQVMDAEAYSVVVAGASVVLGLPVDGPRIAVLVDESLRAVDAFAQAEFRKFTRLLNSPLLGALLDGRPRPFIAMDPAAQEVALAQWRDSRFLLRRSGFLAFRRLCAAAHYSNPTTWPAMGYPGPPRLEAP